MKLSNYMKLSKSLENASSAGVETITQLNVLLYIGNSKSEGRTVSDVVKDCKLSQSSASRNCRFLSKQFNAERKGLGLVDVLSDRVDFRVKLIEGTYNENIT
jgi:DNA-binding MarR family transcriptional regulator